MIWTHFGQQISHLQGSYGPWNSWNILEKKLILNNPEMSLISKQYSANPWNVLEFNKGKI
jgi:hypothetical protein